MQDHDNSRVQQLYRTALKRPADARESWLVEQCEGDPTLLAEVISLLKQSGQSVPGSEQQGASDPDVPQQLDCPHCQHSVVVDTLRDAGDVLCPNCGSTIRSDDLPTCSIPAAEPTTIGGFELLEKLGAGAFGSVWCARDTKLDRLVALKMPLDRNLDARQREVFFREARSVAQLKHPHIVSVHDAESDGDQLYIVSDLVDGAPLSEWLRVRRPSVSTAVEIASVIAQALHHAHENGVIHRDLKPANIIMDQAGQPHITDFGLAKRDTGDATIATDGRLLGTPAYMSPEQAAGRANQVDRRSDVYSWGVIFYELLTGERPFRGSSRMLIQQVLHEEPPRLRSLDGRIPIDLETICLKCLEKRPELRYGSAGEVAEELERFQRGEPIVARPINPVTRGWRWLRRRPAWLAFGGGAVAGLLLFAFAMLATAWMYRSRNVVVQTKLEEVAEDRNKIAAELEDARAQRRDSLQAQRKQIDRELGLIRAIEARVDESAAPSNVAGKESAMRQFPSQGAAADDWRLAMIDNYKRAESTVANPFQDTLQTASLSPAEPGETIRKLDRDQDGWVDAWLYYQNEKLATIELDEFGLGAPDQRLNVEAGTVDRARSWLVAPPAPQLQPEIDPLPFQQMFAAAQVEPGSGNAISAATTPWTRLVQQLWPNWELEGSGLAEDQPISADKIRILQWFQTALDKHLDQWEKEAPDAESLSIEGGWKIEFRPKNLDGKAGDESAVGFSPQGVARVLLSKGEWHDAKKMHALCHVENGQIIRVDFRDVQVFRIGSCWLQVQEAARKEVAGKYLSRAKRQWEAGDWYSAVATFRAGCQLAAIFGDYSIGKDGRPAQIGSLSRELAARSFGGVAVGPAPWRFEVNGESAESLLRLGVGYVWRNRVVVAALRSLAENAAQAGRIADSLERYKMAIRAADRVDDLVQAVQMLDRRSQLHSLVGRYASALLDAEEAAKREDSFQYIYDLSASSRKGAQDSAEAQQALLMRRHAVSVNQACRSARIAALYFTVGDHAGARAALGAAEGQFRSVNHRHGLVDVLNLRACMAADEGSIPDALALARQAASLTESLESSRRKVKFDPRARLDASAIHQFVLGQELKYQRVFMGSTFPPEAYRAASDLAIGDVLWRDEFTAESVREPSATLDCVSFYERAERGFRFSRDVSGALVAQLRLASAALARNELNEATRWAEQASQEAGRRLALGSWAAETVAAKAMMLSGQQEQALASLEAVTDSMTSAGSAAFAPSAHAGLTPLRLDAFELKAQIHANRSQDLDAWRTHEQSKVRRLIEVQSGAGVLPASSELPLQPPSLEHVQRQLRPGELILQFWPTQEKLFCFSISRQTIAMRALPVESEVLAERVRGFLQLIDQTALDKDADSMKRYAAEAQRWRQDLMDPFLTPETRRLIIVADGRLSLLPFHALMDENQRYLVERLRVDYSPSSVSFANQRKRLQARGATPRDDGRLLWVEVAHEQPAQAAASQRALGGVYENRIDRLLPVRDEDGVLHDVDASRLSEALQRADILLFHGYLHFSSFPSRTSLLLADFDKSVNVLQRRRLGLGDIARINGSNCRAAIFPVGSGLFEAGRGDELHAFWHAWDRAGVPTCLVPLWESEHLHSDLLPLFLQQLAESKATVGECWWTAQRDFLKRQSQLSGPTGITPKTWAGMMLVGGGAF